MNKAISMLMILFFSLLNTLASAQSKNEIAIRKVLQTQENAWNSGQLKKFMQGYWKNDSLIFIGKSGITYGWQKTLDNYIKGYPDTAVMGQLTFTLFQLKPISVDCYFVIGKWHLQRSIGNIEGYFTLLFKKISGQWLIVADHSS